MLHTFFFYFLITLRQFIPDLRIHPWKNHFHNRSSHRPDSLVVGTPGSRRFGFVSGLGSVSIGSVSKWVVKYLQASFDNYWFNYFLFLTNKDIVCYTLLYPLSWSDQAVNWRKRRRRGEQIRREEHILRRVGEADEHAMSKEGGGIRRAGSHKTEI